MYTLDSPLRASVSVAGGWHALLTVHAAYGGVDAILAAYAHWCEQYDIDPNLALAQFCHETGYGGSDRWRTEWNPAGLRITSDNTPPNPFASLDDGIHAHIAHVCCHAYADADCPVDHAAPVDRYHVFHLAQQTISDIQTAPYRWAAGLPGQDPLDYVRSIVSIANSVGASPVAEYPTAADIGAPIRVEATSFVGPERAMGDIDWYVIHDTEGHYETDIAVLTHGSQNGSIHALIGREPGQFCVSVPIHTTAWAAGNDTLGARAIQVELSKAPDETGYTDTQYQYLTAFVQWCQKQGVTVPLIYLGLHPTDADNGPLPDERGIIGHAGVPDGAGGWGGFAHHTDPGPQFDWPRFTAMLGNAPPPQPTGHQIDGHTVGDGHYALYTSVDEAHRLIVWGKCLTDEHDEYLVIDAPPDALAKHLSKIAIPVVAVRYERQVAIWDRGRTPAPWDTRVPLVGEVVGMPDNPLVGATLYSMQLAGYTP